LSLSLSFKLERRALHHSHQFAFQETAMTRVKVTAPARILLLIALAVPQQKLEADSKMEKRPFGKTKDGQSVELYILTNKTGMEVAITNFGGTLVSLKTPDRNGKTGDVILGFDTAEEYENGRNFFGGTIGRYGNRIAHGKFTLDGATYTLAKNNGENHLHGGVAGFNKKVWQARDISSSAGQALELTYLSKDGEEGYPGNLSVKVVFTVLAGRNALKIDYSATTDKNTVVNLTNHAYFNLGGQGNGDILKHELTLHASKFNPVDAGLIPTGELKSVAGTPFDFLHPTAIGARINQDDQQLKFGKGYDHNWIVNRTSATALDPAALAYDPQTGRTLEITTTEPGIQFYSGNFLDGTIHGKTGEVYPFRSAFCLETQHFPDSPNQPEFPSTELKPGQQYHSATVYLFSFK
jgi:aldose 1-epimerase